MWSVYIVECSDNSYYCGIAKSVKERIDKHNAGKGAKYTRGRGPVKLLASVNGFTNSEALKLEYKLKKQPRAKRVAFLLSQRGD